MTSYIEFEGKNIKQAVKKACSKLKIDQEKIKYKVISYGSTGIFGLAGRKKAKINVSMPEIKKAGNNEEEKAISTHKENESRENNIQIGKDVLQKIVESITDDAKIEIKERSNKTIFNVVGGNSALLIGKRGKTLEAIQCIVEKIINKKNENRSRTVVDIEGYIEKRNSYLKSLARRLAEKCKRFGKPVSVGEMNAHDRRIIHITLKGDKQVRTRSKGDGVLKRIVIFPQKGFRKKKEMVKVEHEKVN